MREEYFVWLPVATSVNNMYTITSRGVRSSADKTTWETVAWNYLKKQHPERPTGKPKNKYRVQLVMNVYLSDWRRDISNVIKLTEDLLAEYFHFDDRYTTSIQVGRITAPNREEEKVHIQLTLSEVTLRGTETVGEVCELSSPQAGQPQHSVLRPVPRTSQPKKPGTKKTSPAVRGNS